MIEINFKKSLSIDQVFTIAVYHHEHGDYRKAEHAYQHILDVEPEHCLSLNNLGLISLQFNRLDQAEEYFNLAITIDPNYYESYSNLGNLYFQKGQYLAAINFYQQALRITPDDEEVWTNLGNAYLRESQDRQAINCYQKALQLNPNRADLHKNLGDCHYILNQYRDSITSYRNALRINPIQPELYCQTGHAYQNIGLHSKGIECYRHALAFEPNNADLHSQLGTTLLLTGDFANGWKEYEWRRKIDKRKRYFDQPCWSENDCHGQTLLIYAEQGIGDTIQFLRFIPLLENRSLTIIFECQPSLKPLLKNWSCFGAKVQIFSVGETLPQFDSYLPLMSLPFVLNLDSIEKIPSVAPCKIPVDSAKTYCLLEKGSNKVLKVGLVWAGNPEHVRDSNRSITLNKLSALIDSADCKFFSLQVGQARDELYEKRNMPFSSSITDWGGGFGNFFDTAEAISQLDLVISVDTAVAHLSATMGIPTWIMLSANPDWRWMLQRTDSPWYPTTRLFRQRFLGEWDCVIADIAEELVQIKK